MAKLPWYCKVIYSDKERIEFKLRRIYVWFMFIKFKIFKRDFDRKTLDYNG